MGVLPRSGSAGRWDAGPPPGPVRDSFGAGDSFAGGLTYRRVGAGMPIAEAVVLAARCWAACLTGNGPYQGQRPDRASEGKTRAGTDAKETQRLRGGVIT